MFRFFKNTFFSGLAILLPLVLLFLAIKELTELMIAVATPIADMFPDDTFDTEYETEILAALLILGAALTIGLLVRIPGSHSGWHYIESRTLGKLPLYRMLGTITNAFLDMEDNSSFRPALIHGENGEMEPAYIIEDTGGATIVMLIPWSPAAFAGRIQLTPRKNVQKLPHSLDEFSMMLSNYGLGLATVLENKTEN